jgi:hypothetical protein
MKQKIYRNYNENRHQTTPNSQYISLELYKTINIHSKNNLKQNYHIYT